MSNWNGGGSTRFPARPDPAGGDPYNTKQRRRRNQHYQDYNAYNNAPPPRHRTAAQYNSNNRNTNYSHNSNSTAKYNYNHYKPSISVAKKRADTGITDSFEDRAAPTEQDRLQQQAFFNKQAKPETYTEKQEKYSQRKTEIGLSHTHQANANNPNHQNTQNRTHSYSNLQSPSSATSASTTHSAPRLRAPLLHTQPMKAKYVYRQHGATKVAILDLLGTATEHELQAELAATMNEMKQQPIKPPIPTPHQSTPVSALSSPTSTPSHHASIRPSPHVTNNSNSTGNANMSRNNNNNGIKRNAVSSSNHVNEPQVDKKSVQIQTEHDAFIDSEDLETKERNKTRQRTVEQHQGGFVPHDNAQNDTANDHYQQQTNEEDGYYYDQYYENSRTNDVRNHNQRQARGSRNEKASYYTKRAAKFNESRTYQSRRNQQQNYQQDGYQNGRGYSSMNHNSYNNNRSYSNRNRNRNAYRNSSNYQNRSYNDANYYDSRNY
eukprot:CAMPEP_0197041668 /NCGR_PEP_ID=MMETSP1384-20130603/18189_1 /TAXON_ID=29189 /ORGANISM="Ammonia sp." /LENGTH=490 /DNA_ID=CAMNT_0042472641 /DNA_START=21 /DNA_END=1493 /DNA_ORIENTATION=+